MDHCSQLVISNRYLQLKQHFFVNCQMQETVFTLLKNNGVFKLIRLVKRHKVTVCRYGLKVKNLNSPCTVSLAGLLSLLMFSKGLCVTQMYIPSSSNVTLKRCRVPEVFFWLPPPNSPWTWKHSLKHTVWYIGVKMYNNISFSTCLIKRQVEFGNCKILNWTEFMDSMNAALFRAGFAL